MPFCKQCGAPQIRVVGIESAPVAPSESGSHPPEFLTPPPLPPPLPVPRPLSTQARVQWSRALPGAALGGVFSLLALVIPYAIFGPAFMMGGALAVMLYRRHLGGISPAAGVGAQIGAASGGFGFLYSTVMAVARLVYRPEEVQQDILDTLAQMVGRGYDPQRVEQVQQMIKTPDGLMFFVVFGLFVMLVIMVAGSSIGGALYAAWVRRRPSA
jgi:hypothetical protein